MRGKALVGIVLAGIVAAAVAVATSWAAASGSGTVKVSVPLPPESSGEVSMLTLEVTAPKGKRVGSINVSVTNQGDLGTAQTNTQVVGTVSQKSSTKRTATFKVFIFIHHWPAAPARKHSAGSADPPTSVNVTVKPSSKKDQIKAGIERMSLTCQDLDNYGYTTDGFMPLDVLDLVAIYDSPGEEQLDGAVRALCPNAEGDDAGNT